MSPPVYIANKGLTEMLNPLDATLTKNRGEGSFRTRRVLNRHLSSRLTLWPQLVSVPRVGECPGERPGLRAGRERGWPLPSRERPRCSVGLRLAALDACEQYPRPAPLQSTG